MNKFTRQQLELIYRRTLGYPLQIAEKDYFLALAVQLIYDSKLGNKLVFKGGTAIHHCYLSQKRFSQDLDFTSIDPTISLEEVATAIESDETFRVNKRYQSEFSIKIERLQYQGLLGQPGNIKIEIDRHQNVLLPRITTDYRNEWRVNTTAWVMDPREICAQKIRAVSQRARYRDFYDLYFLINELNIDFNEDVNILKRKEIRTPITVANIAKNWEIAEEQKVSNLGTIYCSEELESVDIENLIQIMRFDDINIPD